MDARKLGRRLGRLAAVVTFGAGAALGIPAAATADAEADESHATDVAVVESGANSTKTNTWD